MTDYKNLICVQARSPDRLVEQLRAIPVPSSIMSGSWFTHGLSHGVWVLLDRPVELVSKKSFDSKNKN
jgi:hypothetical protein